MVIMPGGGSTGRRGTSSADWRTSTDRTGASRPRSSWEGTSGSVALLPAPAEALAEGDPVGTYPASADGADTGSGSAGSASSTGSASTGSASSTGAADAGSEAADILSG